MKDFKTSSGLLFKSYLFISGCAGSLLLPARFLQLQLAGVTLVVVNGLLIAVASLVEHGLYGNWASVVVAHGLNGCGPWA